MTVCNWILPDVSKTKLQKLSRAQSGDAWRPQSGDQIINKRFRKTKEKNLFLAVIDGLESAYQ
jgi:hypothetical protein